MKTERRLWMGPLLGVVAAVGCAQVFGLDKEYRVIDDASAVGVLGGSCPQTGQLACAGHAQKSKLICGPDRKWATNGTCDGETLCDTATGQEQGTCKAPIAVCAGKQGAEVVCEGTKRVRCGPDLVTTEEVESCSAQTGLCIAGACVLPPSCKDLTATCGPDGNEPCCAIRAVPGGSYNRSNDPSYPATVSSFLLDRFEITVGRFRKFVAEYPGNKPKAGDGAHPLIAGSGWDAAWNATLPADKPALLAEVKCNSPLQTWTDAVSANENLPMNCISWYAALAFCAWDGGRLPTEAEWNYAAAGGSEQRPYPWGTAGADGAHAVYDCTGNGPAACDPAGILKVGSKPMGDGKWGQADLAGSLWEWNLDFYVSPYFEVYCNNCADLKEASNRVLRGGAFGYPSSYVLSSFRYSTAPTDRFAPGGARCARTP